MTTELTIQKSKALVAGVFHRPPLAYPMDLKHEISELDNYRLRLATLTVAVDGNCLWVAPSLDTVIRRVGLLEKDGEITPLPEEHFDPICNLIVTSKGDMLISSDLDGTVKIWHNGECQRTLRPQIGNLTCLIFLEESQQLVVGNTTGQIAILDLSEKRSGTRYLDTGSGQCVSALAHDEQHLYVGGWDEKLHMFSLNDSGLHRSFSGGVGWITGFAWYDNYLYGSGDHGLQGWQPSSEGVVHGQTIRTGENKLWSILAGETGIFTAGQDGFVKLWRPNQSEAEKFTAHDNELRQLARLDDQRFLSRDQKGIIYFWKEDMPNEPLATLHLLVEGGFLWTTPPDAMAPYGWFYTNRPELISVVDENELGEARVLSDDDPRRRDYLSCLSGFNRPDWVMKRLNDWKGYQQDLKSSQKQEQALHSANALSHTRQMLTGLLGHCGNNEKLDDEMQETANL